MRHSIEDAVVVVYTVGSNKAVATSPSHQYKAVALPDLDPARLKGEDIYRMNRE